MELMDLFQALGAESKQMEYRTLYGSARGGWITEDVGVAVKIAENGGSVKGFDGAATMRGLLDAIIEGIPAPAVHWYGSNSGEGGGSGDDKIESDFEMEPFSMTATTVGYDPYLGRTCTGRIYSGTVRSGDSITLLRRQNASGVDAADDSGNKGNNNNSNGPSTQISGVFANRGVSRVPLDPAIAYAGDIITLTGVPETMKVGDTLTSTNHRVPMAVDTPPLAPPTLSCLFGANNGPLAGKEGKIVTSSRVRARLISETDNNVTRK